MIDIWRLFSWSTSYALGFNILYEDSYVLTDPFIYVPWIMILLLVFKATENPQVMKALMEVLKKEGLYYVDSHTSSRSVGPQIARQEGVAFGSNDRFIDQEKDLEAIKKAIRLAMKRAKQEGKAIAIGHPHPLTARAIREMVPEIEEVGIKLVFASEVVG